MANKVALKVVQYRVADSLDKLRLPSNPRAIINREKNAVCIKFNRPRFLNCLDQTVITPVVAALSEVIKNGNNELVLFEGSNTGKKMYSFTTGGDLLMGRNIIRRHEQTGRIAEAERLYLVNIYRTQHLTKRVSSAGAGVVSLMDGAVMGSGALFGLNSNWSVVTERSVWGIPEVSIAGMPDVGTLYHMYRQGSQLGTMLALTGLRLTSSSIAHAGLATHFCQSSRLPQLRREILETEGNTRRLREVLDRFQSESLNEDKELVNRETITRLKERCSQAYSSDNVEEIVHNLKMCDNEWSKGQLSLLSKACPLSLKVTLRLLRELERAQADYDTSLVRSYLVAGNIYFYGQMRAGIENTLVFRGKRRPDWAMRSLDQVPDSLVDFMFENQFKEQLLTMDQLRDLNTLNPY